MSERVIDIDDAAVLAYLKAKRASLDASIAALEAFLGPTPLEGVPDGVAVRLRNDDEPEQLGPGVFHGLSISEAAKRFLEITKKKQKTRAICDAIQKGGIETGAKNFLSNVYTTLLRNKDFMRLGSYWALAEWYPTKVPAGKPTKKAKRSKRARTQKDHPATPSAKVVDISGATAEKTA